MASSAASPWGTGSPLAPPEFVLLLDCTQVSLRLRAHPHPTAVSVVGQPSFSLASRTRPGLLVRPQDC